VTLAAFKFYLLKKKNVSPNEKFSAKEGKGRFCLEEGPLWLNAVDGMDNRGHS